MKVLGLQLLICSLIPTFSWAGGWTSSGGGSGVVCFKETADKILADRYIDSSTTLPASIVEKIERVEVLDYFEAADFVKEEIEQNFKNEQNWKMLHEQQLQRIQMLTPVFAELLEIVGKKFTDLTWMIQPSLDLLLDQGDQPKIPANCRLIQIALRRSKNEPSTTQGYFGIPARTFEFDFQYNPFWFERLSAINKSMLLLHEELYLLGQSIGGHPKSDDIRYWVREFSLLTQGKVTENTEKHFLPFETKKFESIFSRIGRSENLKEGVNLPKAPNSLRFRLVRSFGDYPLYFFESQETNNFTSPANLRFQDYNRFLLALRDFGRQCQNDASMARPCRDLLLEPSRLSQKITDLQAFAYISSRMLDKVDGVFNSDYLFIRGSNLKSLEMSDRATEEACLILRLKIKNGLDESILARKGYSMGLYEKALNYCTSIKH